MAAPGFPPPMSRLRPALVHLTGGQDRSGTGRVDEDEGKWVPVLGHPNVAEQPSLDEYLRA